MGLTWLLANASLIDSRPAVRWPLSDMTYQFNGVTAITDPNFPASNVTYTYGAASLPWVGNVVGRITHITDGAGMEDRLCGSLGEIVSETGAIPIQGGQVNTGSVNNRWRNGRRTGCTI